MIKKCLASLAVFLCFSCTSATYIFDNPGQTTGVDFSQGKWLLNEVNVPHYLTQRITALATKDFSENLGERLRYIPDTKGLLLPQKEIQLNPEKSVLNNLHKGTNSDYLINIKARENRNDFGPIDLTNHNAKTGNASNESEVTIEIYDLKNATIIYSQKVIASVAQVKNSSDVSISKNQYQLILSSYKKLTNDINKKSIH